MSMLEACGLKPIMLFFKPINLKKQLNKSIRQRNTRVIGWPTHNKRGAYGRFR